MKTAKDNAKIQNRTAAQWKLHQQIAALVIDLDRLPDAQEIREDQPVPAPLNLLPMVF